MDVLPGMRLPNRHVMYFRDPLLLVGRKTNGRWRFEDTDDFLAHEYGIVIPGYDWIATCSKQAVGYIDGSELEFGNVDGHKIQPPGLGIWIEFPCGSFLNHIALDSHDVRRVVGNAYCADSVAFKLRVNGILRGSILPKEFHFQEEFVDGRVPLEVNISSHPLTCAVNQVAAFAHKCVCEIDFEHPSAEIAGLPCGAKLLEQCPIPIGCLDSINLRKKSNGIFESIVATASSLDDCR